MNKYLIGSLITGGVLTAAGVGAGVVAGVVVPKALKAKKGLESFVSEGGSYNSLANKRKVNIVALGDSETAGYNGILKRDYRSYADFLAASFKNANKLGSYHNFANSGERLSDIKRTLFENPEKVRQLHDADLITITIGANDILAYIKFLTLPYSTALGLMNDPSGISKLGKIGTPFKLDENGNKIQAKNADGSLKEKVIPAKQTTLGGFPPAAPEKREPVYEKDRVIVLSGTEDEWRTQIPPQPGNHPEAINNIDERTEIFGDNTSAAYSKEESKNMFINGMKDIQNLLNGQNQSLINLDSDWFPKVFDLVKREMAVLIRDLHTAAPNAHIEVLGHAFPFSQMDKGVFNNKKPELNNTSISDNFKRLLDQMNAGAKTSIGDNDFVTFTSISDIPEFKDHFKEIQYDDKTTFFNSFKKNVMPNIQDIHPSTYGHEIIGDYLFKKYGKENGLSNANITQDTQHSFDIGTQDNPNTIYDESKWTRLDEEQSKIESNFDSAKTFHSLTNIGSILPSDLIDLNPLIKGLAEKPSPTGTGTIGDLLSGFTGSKIKDQNFKLDAKNLINTIFNDALDIVPSNTEYKDYDMYTFVDNVNNSSHDVINLLIKLSPLGSVVSSQLGFNPSDIVTSVGNIINTSRIITRDLKTGVNDSRISDYEQYKKAMWGFTTMFTMINDLKSKMGSMISKLSSATP